MGVTSRLLDAMTAGSSSPRPSGRSTTSPIRACCCRTRCVDGELVPIETPRTDHRSDFVTQFALNAFQDWSSDIGVQWNPQASQFERAEVNIQYKPAGQTVINLAYRFERDVLEQAEVSGAWPIGGDWNIFVRGVYSLQDTAAGEFRRVRVRFVLLAGPVRGTPLHQQPGPAPGHRCVAATGTHGSGKCRICIGYFPDHEIRGYTRGKANSKTQGPLDGPLTKETSCVGFFSGLPHCGGDWRRSSLPCRHKD